MIKIQDIQPADILPEGLRDDVSALGIAYAICRQIEKWCAFNDGIMIYYMIASLPDEILISWPQSTEPQRTVQSTAPT